MKHILQLVALTHTTIHYWIAEHANPLTFALSLGDFGIRRWCDVERHKLGAFEAVASTQTIYNYKGSARFDVFIWLCFCLLV